MLKSWALPKGPSTDPARKRLAVPVEDHDLGYALFEGVIPEGRYGAGAVLVWDMGTYRLPGGQGSLDEALGRGLARVWIDGRKIRGGYSLVRAGKIGWLLIKDDDDEADPGRDPVKDEPASVLSGLTIEQIAAGGGRALE